MFLHCSIGYTGCLKCYGFSLAVFLEERRLLIAKPDLKNKQFFQMFQKNYDLNHEIFVKSILSIQGNFKKVCLEYIKNNVLKKKQNFFAIYVALYRTF